MATILLLCAAGLALYGLLHSHGRRRWAALAILLVFTTTTWHQRFWVLQGNGYPYGYYKVIAMASPFAVLLTVSGGAQLYRHLQRVPAPFRSGGRTSLALLCFGLGALGIFYTITTSAALNQRALVVTESMLELEAINSLIPADEPLLMLDQSNPSQIWQIYLLQRSRVYTHAPSLSFWLPLQPLSNALTRYALIARYKPPVALAIDDDGPWFRERKRTVVWENRDFLLVRRTDQAVAEQAFTAAGMHLGLRKPLSVNVSKDSLIVRGAPGYKKLQQRLAGHPARLNLFISVSEPAVLKLEQNKQISHVRLGRGFQRLRFPIEAELTLKLQTLSGTLRLNTLRVMGTDSPGPTP